MLATKRSREASPYARETPAIAYLFVGANRILDWIAENKLPYFPYRACWRNHRSYFKTANVCKDALAVLEENGYIREQDPDSSGRRVGYLVSPHAGKPPAPTKATKEAGHGGQNGANASATGTSGNTATVATSGPTNGQAAIEPSTPGATKPSPSSGQNGHKILRRCCDCGVEKDAVADFGPRYSHCAKHARPGDPSCPECVAHQVDPVRRQARCRPCVLAEAKRRKLEAASKSNGAIP